MYILLYSIQCNRHDICTIYKYITYIIYTTHNIYYVLYYIFYMEYKCILYNILINLKYNIHFKKLIDFREGKRARQTREEHRLVASCLP